MRSFITIVRMVAQRAAGHWRLLAGMTAGVVLAAALMSCVALYSDAIRNLGLRHALAGLSPVDHDVTLSNSSQRLGPADYAKGSGITDGLLQARLGSVVRGILHFDRSATFFPTAPGAAVSEDEGRPRANLQFADGFDGHVRYVAGRAPTPAPAGAPGAPPSIEAAIGKAAADHYGLHVGDTFDLHPHWAPEAAPVHLVISGIVEPSDPGEEYWQGHTDRFDLNTTWPTYLFWVPQQTAVNAVGAYLPDMDSGQDTYALVEVGRIHAGNARATEDAIAALRGDAQAQLQYTTVTTKLDSTLTTYRERLFFTRLPLFALMLQIIGVAMFYLAMVSTMVVDRQSGEIALFKSRGAGTGQIMMFFLIEGAGIGLLATIAGPLLAMGAISVLGLTPPFHDLSGGSLIDVSLSPEAFGLAAGGALLALLALLWPAYRACRLSITHYKQQISRPQRQPAFLRYYLDLALIAVGAFLFYELRQRGSLVTHDLFGGLSADPLLLATPSLFLLMVALVFLRLFPLLMRLALWLARSLRGPVVALGLTRMARSPVQHSRLILLLILSTAVGMFAAGFRATLDRSYADRAAYQAGAEVRITGITEPSSLPPAQLQAAVAKATGAHDVSPAVRTSGYYSTSLFNSLSLDLLALRSQDFLRGGFWRGDFAGDTPSSLFARLKQPPPAISPAEVPRDARFIGLWVASSQNGSLPLGLRLQDGDGSFWEYRMTTEGQSQAGKWQFYAADLTKPAQTHPTGVTPSAADRHWRVDAVYFGVGGAQSLTPVQAAVLVSDVQTSPASSLASGWGQAGFPDGAVVEPFRSADGWEVVDGATAAGDSGVLSQLDNPPGRMGSVVRLVYTRARGGIVIAGIRRALSPSPLPVLAARPFLDLARLSVGQVVDVYLNHQYTRVKIVGSFDLFPGYDSSKRDGLFVADFDAARTALTRLPGLASDLYPNEAWVLDHGTAPVTQDALTKAGVKADAVFDREALQAAAASDPLVAASWEGILFLSFAAVLILVTLGFVIYAALGAQTRSLEFAVLRTMGLSGRQILSVVMFEQVFVVGAGVIAGTLLGFPLSRLMIGYMGITEDGAKPLPPLVSVVDWQAISTVYVLLAVVVICAIGALAAVYSRVAVSRALRMGDL